MQFQAASFSNDIMNTESDDFLLASTLRAWTMGIGVASVWEKVMCAHFTTVAMSDKPGFSMSFSCARPLGSERLEESMLLNRNGKGQLRPLNLSGFPWPRGWESRSY
jgi:hypothetical protein